MLGQRKESVIRTNVLIFMKKALDAHDRLIVTTHRDRRILLNVHTQLLSSFRSFHWSDTTHKGLPGVHDFVSIAIKRLGTLLPLLPAGGLPTIGLVARASTMQFPVADPYTPRGAGVSLDGRQVKFLNYDTHEPRTIIHTRLLPWESRLRQNPPVPVNNLQTELMRYATELLLFMGLQGMFDGRHHDFTRAGGNGDP